MIASEFVSNRWEGTAALFDCIEAVSAVPLGFADLIERLCPANCGPLSHLLNWTFLFDFVDC